MLHEGGELVEAPRVQRGCRRSRGPRRRTRTGSRSAGPRAPRTPRREGTCRRARSGPTRPCGLHAHVVFPPRYRRGPFTDEILSRCEDIMRNVCADFGTELVEFNGERDHVRLLVHYPPKVS
ncbi:IS200/IS605 family transposase [Streptomyces sp. NPDC090022]|uniref:IS200/IS605 family transposase n=1 Tax=Streptomyces sp. NPDC090022 TaxID=3365920 RepID=UPI0037F77DE2